jgi:hypothetical protein
MAVTVKRITLWRTYIENKPGELARALAPLANLGVDLQIVMGYRVPGEEHKAIVELFPVAGKRATSAAESAGLGPAAIPTLLVQGENAPGLAHGIAQAVAGAGINLNFMMAQVIGKTYSAVIGLDNEEDAQAATRIIKKAARA